MVSDNSFNNLSVRSEKKFQPVRDHLKQAWNARPAALSLLNVYIPSKCLTRELEWEGRRYLLQSHFPRWKTHFTRLKPAIAAYWSRRNKQSCMEEEVWSGQTYSNILVWIHHSFYIWSWNRPIIRVHPLQPIFLSDCSVNVLIFLNFPQ